MIVSMSSGSEAPSRRRMADTSKALAGDVSLQTPHWTDAFPAGINWAVKP